LDIYIQYLLYERKEKQIEQAEEQKAKETIGELKKCPNCGEVYVLGTLVCKCGYMLDVTIKSDAYQIFVNEVAKKISAIKGATTEQNPFSALGQTMTKSFNKTNPRIVAIQQFISSYPVPNNRIDLLEFIVNLQSVANPKAPKGSISSIMLEDNFDFGYYYWELFTSCINKAKVYFPNDKDFQPYFERHKEMSTQKKGLFSKLFG
jgi:ribosomal protein L32